MASLMTDIWLLYLINVIIIIIIIIIIIAGMAVFGWLCLFSGPLFYHCFYAVFALCVSAEVC